MMETVNVIKGNYSSFATRIEETLIGTWDKIMKEYKTLKAIGSIL